MAHRVLVVPTVRIPESVIRAHLRGVVAEDSEVEIVAPASNIGWLDWLTNAEDDARAEAADRAEQVSEALPTDSAGVHVGDTDPRQAIEDALRMFPADELIVVTRPGDQANWLEAGTGEAAQERLSIPVTHLVVADDDAT